MEGHLEYMNGSLQNKAATPSDDYGADHGPSHLMIGLVHQTRDNKQWGLRLASWGNQAPPPQTLTHESGRRSVTAKTPRASDNRGSNSLGKLQSEGLKIVDRSTHLQGAHGSSPGFPGLIPSYRRAWEWEWWEYCM